MTNSTHLGLSNHPLSTPTPNRDSSLRSTVLRMTKWTFGMSSKWSVANRLVITDLKSVCIGGIIDSTSLNARAVRDYTRAGRSHYYVYTIPTLTELT
ncbi:MAG: hypothetical protein IGR93_21765 [Hydrococcus sp. C42_A2020_068]|nr:hypothetical protein Ple7327_4202 [Pleurocapsa sp. PCC 7327]MBF2022642.1 hypothetical protein [Hydrococcus sp. C42_A2020_068]